MLQQKSKEQMKLRTQDQRQDRKVFLLSPFIPSNGRQWTLAELDTPKGPLDLLLPGDWVMVWKVGKVQYINSWVQKQRPSFFSFPHSITQRSVFHQISQNFGIHGVIGYLLL
ncbi:Hypothetical_protein [Hexamita inflata]|uniref:Hypothetical_protein n=1 Tax=Hexamita inflata TaxID=28002 RepID=A0AA86RN79_9EUKA|nr:Hypothetical protein HINF_LOCUS65563 [Hexamita inflata]